MQGGCTHIAISVDYTQVEWGQKETVMSGNQSKELSVAMQPRMLIDGVGRMLAVTLVACSQVLPDDSEAMSVSFNKEGEPLGETDVVAQGDLEMTSSRDERVLALDQDINLNDDGQDTLSVSGEIEYEDQLNVQLRGDFVDLLELGNGEDEEKDFAFIQAYDLWRENAVGDTEIILSSFNDRLSFTWRRAWSNYEESEAYQNDLNGSQELHGGASLYGADAVLWDGSDGNLSVFAQQSEVDGFFESDGGSEDDESGRSEDDGSGGFGGNEDPFSNSKNSNRKTVRVGATALFGPMQVMLHQNDARMIEKADDDEATAPNQELRQGVSVWINLDDLRSRAGDAFQGSVWSWAPDSVWVDVSRTQVETSEPSDPPDAGRDISVGASWSWNSAYYADASFWRSVYDSRGAWVDDYDYTGHGADVSFGFYNSAWSVDTSFGLNRSENLETAARAVDSGLEGSLSVTLMPEVLPDLSGGLYVGRYGYEYRAFDASNRITYDEVIGSDIWELGLDLDFSKYLADWKMPGQPKLKMTFKCGNTFFMPDESMVTDYVAAVLFQIKL